MKYFPRDLQRPQVLILRVHTATICSEQNCFCFQTIGGIRIMDCLSAKTYDFDDIAKIFIHSSRQSPFEVS